MFPNIQNSLSFIRQWSFQPALYLVCGWRKLFQINVWISEFFVDNVYFITLSEQLQSSLVKIWSHKVDKRFLSEFGSPRHTYCNGFSFHLLWILNWNISVQNPASHLPPHLYRTLMVKLLTKVMGRMVGGCAVSSQPSGGDQYWRSCDLRPSGALLHMSPV